MTQIFIKITLTFGILGVAIWMVVLIWKRDIDVKRFLRLDRFMRDKIEEKIDWIPEREKDAIYQDDKIVAHVEGYEVNEYSKEVYFERITHRGQLDRESPFIFQQFKLQVQSYGTKASVKIPEMGKAYLLGEVRCNILDLE